MRLLVNVPEVFISYCAFNKVITQKTFNINIPTETIEEMLERASKNISIVDGYPSSVKVNVSKGMLDIPITWNGNIANLKYNNIEYKKQF